MRLKIIKGDITKCRVDAIVNAANHTLLGGGGVDGAIHRAAGPELVMECRRLGGCQTGEAKITNGYCLPAKYVIHTVGPVWSENNKEQAQLLLNCYINSLNLAVNNGCMSVAFPSISTGVYRYPLEEAAPIAVGGIQKFLREYKKPMDVFMVCFDVRTLEAYKCAMNAICGFKNEALIE